MNAVVELVAILWEAAEDAWDAANLSGRSREWRNCVDRPELWTARRLCPWPDRLDLSLTATVGDRRDPVKLQRPVKNAREIASDY